MAVISVRIPDSLQEELKQAGVKIAQTVRDDLTRLAKRLRLERREAILSKYRRPATRPVADIVRDARDDH